MCLKMWHIISYPKITIEHVISGFNGVYPILSQTLLRVAFAVYPEIGFDLVQIYPAQDCVILLKIGSVSTL
jgi:hypothetical protein